jgi:cation diffusion facilitator CzcD-associated flavoprotein CzcO
MAIFQYCRRFPERAKEFIVGQVGKAVRGSTDIGHFTPTYKPWDQRLCLVPDGDLFKSIKSGKASVVTGHIDSFTETGIKLKSGEDLEADLIVTATGLRLKFLGGVTLEVDGKRIEPSTLMAYKGVMFSDVPNLAIAIGYTNASWTLKCDLASKYVCRLLAHMDAGGYSQVWPRKTDPSVSEEPLLGLKSGYVERAMADFPKQGSVSPWKLHQNYALDSVILRHLPIADRSLEFTP